VVALLAAANPQATAAQIRTAILSGTTVVAGLTGKVATGGLLNAANAMQLLSGTTPPVTTPVTPTDPLEPNDSIASASQVALVNGRATVSGIVGNGANGARDVDLYAINLVAGAVLTIDVDARSLSPASPLDSFVRLFNAAGSQLASNDDSGDSRDSYLVFTVPTTGTYYVGVSGYGNAAYNPSTAGSGSSDGSIGDYSTTFAVALPALGADIVDVTPDPRTTAVDSIAIIFNRAVTGFDVADLRLVRDGLDVSLAGAVVTSTDGVSWVLVGLASATSSTGVYTLTLNAANSGIVDANGIALTTSVLDTWTVKAAALVDAGDTLSTASVIPAGQVGTVRLSGRIGDGRSGAKDVDLYRVTLLAGQRLIVDIDARSLAGSSTLDSYVRLFNSTGRQLAYNDDLGVSYDSYLAFTAPTAGTYYVGVSGYGNVSYTPTRDASGRNGSTGVYQIAMGFSGTAATAASRMPGSSMRMMGSADSVQLYRQAAFAAFSSNCAAVPATSFANRNIRRR